MSLNHYRIDLMYVGTSFCGWQSQANDPTVQDCLQKILLQVLSEDIRLTGSSRTDTGVHARHQVATFRTEQQIDCQRLFASLRSMSPESVGIISVKPCSEEFHPIVSSKAKVYCYRLRFDGPESPFTEPFVWHHYQRLDVEQMQLGARHFIGTHDFSSFCASDSTAKTKTRTILAIKFVQHGAGVDIWFLGNGFLKQMIRSMVGSLVEIGLGKKPADSIKTVLSARDRTKAGVTAPAKGLCLERILFDDVVSEEKLDQIVKERQGEVNPW